MGETKAAGSTRLLLPALLAAQAAFVLVCHRGSPAFAWSLDASLPGELAADLPATARWWEALAQGRVAWVLQALVELPLRAFFGDSPSAHRAAALAQALLTTAAGALLLRDRGRLAAALGAALLAFGPPLLRLEQAVGGDAAVGLAPALLGAALAGRAIVPAGAALAGALLALGIACSPVLLGLLPAAWLRLPPGRGPASAAALLLPGAAAGLAVLLAGSGAGPGEPVPAGLDGASTLQFLLYGGPQALQLPGALAEGPDRVLWAGLLVAWLAVAASGRRDRPQAALALLAPALLLSATWFGSLPARGALQPAALGHAGDATPLLAALLLSLASLAGGDGTRGARAVALGAAGATAALLLASGLLAADPGPPGARYRPDGGIRLSAALVREAAEPEEALGLCRGLTGDRRVDCVRGVAWGLGRRFAVELEAEQPVIAERVAARCRRLGEAAGGVLPPLALERECFFGLGWALGERTPRDPQRSITGCRRDPGVILDQRDWCEVGACWVTASAFRHDPGALRAWFPDIERGGKPLYARGLGRLLGMLYEDGPSIEARCRRALPSESLPQCLAGVRLGETPAP